MTPGGRSLAGILAVLVLLVLPSCDDEDAEGTDGGSDMAAVDARAPDGPAPDLTQPPDHQAWPEAAPVDGPGATDTQPAPDQPQPTDTLKPVDAPPAPDSPSTCVCTSQQGSFCQGAKVLWCNNNCTWTVQQDCDGYCKAIGSTYGICLGPKAAADGGGMSFASCSCGPAAGG